MSQEPLCLQEFMTILTCALLVGCHLEMSHGTGSNESGALGKVAPVSENSIERLLSFSKKFFPCAYVFF